jgi:deazaflavin-dependent oxidoreductase (nitroreductase family)
MDSSVDTSRPLSTEQYCYLTTTGRVSGKPHTIEIWFAGSPEEYTIYMLAGGGHRADWVKNIEKDPDVSVRAGKLTLKGIGRVVTGEEEALKARKLVVAKYYGREYNPSGGWEATSLPIAIDLQV